MSILQEAIEMARRGVQVNIAVSRKNTQGDYISLIMALSSAITSQGVRDMVILYDGECCWPKPPSMELIKLAGSFDIVVATYHTTVTALEEIVMAHPAVMPAYYVQDYEPWFTCSPFLCPFRGKLTFYNRIFNKPLVTKEKHFKFTESTYTAVSGKVFLFAKTSWIKSMVENNHEGTQVHLVLPSIDHTVYHSRIENTEAKEKVARTLPLITKAGSPASAGRGSGRVRVVAMLRPRTPRRNSVGCLDLLLRLAYHHSHLAQVSFFGVDSDQLNELLATLVELRGPARHRTRHALRGVNVLGLLRQRRDLAALYRSSDLFVDVSWWQAFGRSAVEAMACGCVPVLPAEGAAKQVCRGGRVCRFHDGTDEEGYFSLVVSLVQNHTERHRMMVAGMERAREFSIRGAASSIEEALVKGWAERGGSHIQ